ncbi:MAG: hypothetical protein IPI77_20020 [Saprospiraceae bacterium]|nr:hypothetical protein [Saprospiraceae bacterium]
MPSQCLDGRSAYPIIFGPRIGSGGRAAVWIVMLLLIKIYAGLGGLLFSFIHKTKYFPYCRLMFNHVVLLALARDLQVLLMDAVPGLVVYAES